MHIAIPAHCIDPSLRCGRNVDLWLLEKMRGHQTVVQHVNSCGSALDSTADCDEDSDDGCAWADGHNDSNGGDGGAHGLELNASTPNFNGQASSCRDELMEQSQRCFRVCLVTTVGVAVTAERRRSRLANEFGIDGFCK